MMSRAAVPEVRLPDLAIGFHGDVDGYGHLARSLHGLERTLNVLRPATVFRCHRGERRMRLVGDVPLEEVAAVTGLARVATGLGMRVSCTMQLPARTSGLRHLRVLSEIGGVGQLVLDVSAVPVEAAEELRPAVVSVLDAISALGLGVEVRGAIPVIMAAGVLRDEWLDGNGVTIYPLTASVVERVRSSAELFFGVDGGWHLDEAAWRRGEPPIGSVHGETDEVTATLRRALTRWKNVQLTDDLLEGAA